MNYSGISTLSSSFCSISVMSKYQLSRIAVSIALSYQKTIANQINKNKTQSIFLKIPSGSLAHFALLINLCPKSAIKSNIIQRPRTYANRLIKPVSKLIGRIIAKITAYVGLQLENTGQSDNQTNIDHINHFFVADLPKFWLDLSDNHSFVEKFFQTLGKRVTSQNITKIAQENIFQTIGSTQINTVEAFNSNENTIIETQREAIIIYGLYLSLASVADAHIITGSKGNTHGARIVKTQAKKETINKVIICKLYNKVIYNISIYLK